MKEMYKKTPTVYQMEATECGAASLSMILGYFGKFMPLEQLRIETGVSRDGCNAKNILRAARKFGLEAKGYRKGLEGLLEIKPPCIIHWNFNHFVVWEGMKGNYAYINDPAVGRRKLTIEDIDDCFTGVVLTFEKTPAFEKTKEKKNLIGFIRQRLHGQYSALVALLAIGLCLVFPGMLIRTPIVKVIASPAYRIPTRREFHLINLSDKAVVDVYLLFPAAIRAFYSFVHHDFLNQGV